MIRTVGAAVMVGSPDRTGPGRQNARRTYLACVMERS